MEANKVTITIPPATRALYEAASRTMMMRLNEGIGRYLTAAFPPSVNRSIFAAYDNSMTRILRNLAQSPFMRQIEIAQRAAAAHQRTWASLGKIQPLNVQPMISVLPCEECADRAEWGERDERRIGFRD